MDVAMSFFSTISILSLKGVQDRNSSEFKDVRKKFPPKTEFYKQAFLRT